MYDQYSIIYSNIIIFKHFILHTHIDSKNLCDNIVRLLVGTVSNCGYSSWGQKDDTHRRQCKKLGVFRETWPENGGALPWRLTKAARELLHGRMMNILWPHYLEPLAYRGCSFWQKPGHMWKARRKYRLLFFVLPTQLRDQVPRLRDALLLFTWSIRRLMGSVHSYDVATKVLGILPGSPVVIKAVIPSIQRDLAVAMALLEGCGPIDHIKPCFHHFEHYAEFTITHAILLILWMMAFERYNKYLKEHVRNAHHPEINLAHTTSQTDTANFFRLTEEDKFDLPSQVYHICSLSSPSSTKSQSPINDLEIGSLRVLGVNVEDILSFVEYKVAHILGKHFRAGEWGQYRCGSVVTCVREGQSYYARVDKFFKIEEDDDSIPGYASVTWFAEPQYPLGFPIVVRCANAQPQSLVDNFGCVIRITEIDPSQVMVERDGDYSWMMRDTGFDTTLK